MTSTSRIRANRQNAQKSTGPRTRAGKDRVSHNALRHGLATDLSADPVFAAQIEALARALVGAEAAEPALLETARVAAMAELDLIRIRRIRSDLLVELARSTMDLQSDADDLPMLSLVQEGIQAGLNRRELHQFLRERQTAQPSSRINVSLANLAHIERYERRAMSRRKGLLRALSALQSKARRP